MLSILITLHIWGDTFPCSLHIWYSQRCLMRNEHGSIQPLIYSIFLPSTHPIFACKFRQLYLYQFIHAKTTSLCIYTHMPSNQIAFHTNDVYQVNAHSMPRAILLIMCHEPVMKSCEWDCHYMYFTGTTYCHVYCRSSRQSTVDFLTWQRAELLSFHNVPLDPYIHQGVWQCYSTFTSLCPTVWR